jgi:hypothetical protein
MRARLASLSLNQVRALLAEEKRRAIMLDTAAEAAAPDDYLSALLGREPHHIAEPPASPSAPAPAVAPLHHWRDALWRRWVLAPGVELHVRADAEARYGAWIRRLVQVTAGAPPGAVRDSGVAPDGAPTDARPRSDAPEYEGQG